MTISYRVRKQIVDYFAQRKSSQEIASMLNVSLDQIQDWRRRYKHGHEDWVFSDHQKFSIQERKEILVDFFSQQKYVKIIIYSDDDSHSFGHPKSQTFGQCFRCR